MLHYLRKKFLCYKIFKVWKSKTKVHLIKMKTKLIWLHWNLGAWLIVNSHYGWKSTQNSNRDTMWHKKDFRVLLYTGLWRSNRAHGNNTLRNETLEKQDSSEITIMFTSAFTSEPLWKKARTVRSPRHGYQLHFHTYLLNDFEQVTYPLWVCHISHLSLSHLHPLSFSTPLWKWR